MKLWSLPVRRNSGDRHLNDPNSFTRLLNLGDLGVCPRISLCLFVAIFPFEIGAVLTGTHLHKIDETPTGVGARFQYHFTRQIALDAEFVDYRKKTSALFGTKTGFRFDRFGVFGKGRLGFWHFSNFSKSYFAADTGGVLEYYPSSRTVVRIDIGDTIIFYGGAQLGTVHNFQPGLGFSYKF